MNIEQFLRSMQCFLQHTNLIKNAKKGEKTILQCFVQLLVISASLWNHITINKGGKPFSEENGKRGKTRENKICRKHYFKESKT